MKTELEKIDEAAKALVANFLTPGEQTPQAVASALHVINETGAYYSLGRVAYRAMVLHNLDRLKARREVCVAQVQAIEDPKRH